MARMPIRMPKMSMTMTEGEVSEWLVEVGATIAEGDAVCEVMTDKVDMEVESPVAGTLVEIVVPSGTVQVGEPIGWVEGEDTGGGFGDLLAEPEPEPEPQPEPEPEPEPEPQPQPQPAAPAASPAPDERPLQQAAVPRARALARERGLDLSQVRGTGPDGLVRVADVDAPRAARPAAGEDRRRTVRRAVARAMSPSALVPQFTVWRQLRLEAAEARRDGVSWTTVLLQAYAAALREVPDLLSRWEDDGPAPAGPPSIALAVATPRGLLVPTFAEPDRAHPRDLDAEVRDVVAAARRGRQDPAHLGIANGSLSNLGGQGVDRFQALLTPPQASVLSLGTIAPRPVAVPGGVGVALTVEAGVTVDHRVADGAHAAELLAALARRLGDGG